MAKAAKLIAMRREKVLLVRRREDGLWMFPGGRRRRAKTTRCLRREITEELPKLKLGRLVLWREATTKNKYSGGRMSDALFIAKKTSGRLEIGDEKELDKAVWRKPRRVRLTPTSRYIRESCSHDAVASVGQTSTIGRLGVISDTHGLLRPEAQRSLAGVDHIIHAGDIGHQDVVWVLSRIAPVTAIRGNVDKAAWAKAYPETQSMSFAGRSIFVLHDLKAMTSLLAVAPSERRSRILRRVRRATLLLADTGFDEVSFERLQMREEEPPVTCNVVAMSLDPRAVDVELHRISR